MKFFSNEARENTDDEPAGVPQQRAGSPWKDDPDLPVRGEHDNPPVAFPTGRRDAESHPESGADPEVAHPDVDHAYGARSDVGHSGTGGSDAESDGISRADADSGRDLEGHSRADEAGGSSADTGSSSTEGGVAHDRYRDDEASGSGPDGDGADRDRAPGERGEAFGQRADAGGRDLDGAGSAAGDSLSSDASSSDDAAGQHSRGTTSGDAADDQHLHGNAAEDEADGAQLHGNAADDEADGAQLHGSGADDEADDQRLQGSGADGGAHVERIDGTTTTYGPDGTVTETRTDEAVAVIPAAVGGAATAGTGTPAAAPVGAGSGNERLFTDGDSFNDRFRDIQLRFVDSPKEATAEAAALVKEAVDRLTSTLNSQKDALASDSEDTEKLRVELRGYREILNRLTAL